MLSFPSEWEGSALAAPLKLPSPFFSAWLILEMLHLHASASMHACDPSEDALRNVHFLHAREPSHGAEPPPGVQAGRFDLVSMHWAIGDEQTVQQATASLHHVTGDSHPERLLVTGSDRAQVGQGSLIGSWSQAQGATQMELPAKVGIELGWGESSVHICTAGHQSCAACRTSNQSRLLPIFAMCTQHVSVLTAAAN